MSDVEQQEQVSSWLHDEQRHVTTQTISWTFGTSRNEAARILQQCRSSDASFQAIVVNQNSKQREDGVLQTAFSLSKHATLNLSSLSGSLYSLKLASCPESIATAHQRDLQLVRDALSSHEPHRVLDHNASMIRPSVPLKRSPAQAVQASRLNTVGAVAQDRHATAAPKTTVTTAELFFGKSSDSSIKTKSTPAATSAARQTDNEKSKIDADSKKEGDKKDHSAITNSKRKSKSEASAKASSSKKSFFGNNVSASMPTATATSTSRTKTTSVATGTSKSSSKPATSESLQPEEKENAPNVGTADDFVGDEDEDDEFWEEEKQRRERNIKQQKKEEVAEKRQQEQHQQEKEQQRSQPVPTTKAKKRLKKLVEKTTMDEHGYMHTETHVVWEEIDDDAEQEAPASATKTKPTIKPTKHMKQGNLMGFFKIK